MNFCLPSLDGGIIVQSLGDEILLYDSRDNRVHHLSGSAAIVVSCLPEESDAVVTRLCETGLSESDAQLAVAAVLAQLTELGVLQAPRDSQDGFKTFSRRDILKYAAMLPAVVTILAPMPAHAQSVLPEVSAVDCSLSAGASCGNPCLAIDGGGYCQSQDAPWPNGSCGCLPDFPVACGCL